MEGVKEAKEAVVRHKRHVFTEDERYVLGRAFSKNKHPDLMQILELAEELDVDEDLIMVWFRNKRNAVNAGLKKQIASLANLGEDGSSVSRKCKFSEDQRRTLEGAYEDNDRPDLTTRQKLAAELGVTETQTRVWFQNRRNGNSVVRRNKSEQCSVTSSSDSSAIRKRHVFSNNHRSVLEQSYESNPRPSSATIEKLAEELDVTERQIKVWFQNKKAVDTLHDTIVKPKRHVFSHEELFVLEKLYEDNTHPNLMTRQIIAERLGLNENQIRIWFQNRRTTNVKRKFECAATNVNESISTGAVTMCEDVKIPTALEPLNDANTDVGNVKKQQNTRFSKHHLQCLYAEFEKEQCPDVVRRKVLSLTLGVPERSVKIWFQNMRQALKIKNLTFQEFLNSKYVRQAEVTQREETAQENFPGTESAGSCAAGPEPVKEGLESGKNDCECSVGLYPGVCVDDCYGNAANSRGASEFPPKTVEPEPNMVYHEDLCYWNHEYALSN